MDCLAEKMGLHVREGTTGWVGHPTPKDRREMEQVGVDLKKGSERKKLP